MNNAEQKGKAMMRKDGNNDMNVATTEMDKEVGSCSTADIRREFDCIVGYETIKDDLVRICDTIRNRGHYMKLGAEIPRGLLICGVPGVGKTTMAECMIKACGRPAVRLRKSSSKDKFIDSIKEAFDEAADREPSVLFLDDVDKFAEEPVYMMIDDEDIGCGTSTEYAVLQTCMDGIAGRDVFVIATANRAHSLPDSLIRPGRFDRVRQVYAPGVHDAEMILDKYLGRKKLAADVDYRRLAVLMSGASCSRIEALANDAGLIAGYERAPEINMDHIARAYLRWWTSGKTEDLTPDEKLRVAYHEAGHVVMMERLMPGVIDIVCAKRESGALFFDEYIDGLLLGINDDRNRMAALKYLGGRAAIEEVYGEVDDMSEGDVATARFYVTDAVTSGYDGHMDLYQSRMMKASSEATLEMIEEAVAEEMVALYREALSVMREERAFLDRLARAMTENEYLLADDIEKLKSA